VTHKNSCDVPSVTGGSDTVGTVPVRSHVSVCPISSVPPASHPKLVWDSSHLYFYFTKYGFKAGYLCCKDLLELFSSRLKHSQICPWWLVLMKHLSLTVNLTILQRYLLWIAWKLQWILVSWWRMLVYQFWTPLQELYLLGAYYARVPISPLGLLLIYSPPWQVYWTYPTNSVCGHSLFASSRSMYVVCQMSRALQNSCSTMYSCDQWSVTSCNNVSTVQEFAPNTNV